MGKGKPESALGQLRTLFASGTATGLTDRELLEQYATARAESLEAATAAEMAFAALVDRHGAMVWGVCRRILGDAHAAEDAFQATFLVLVRKAGSIRVDGSLGRWLYGVAHRVAVRARAGVERRESRMDRFPAIAPEDPVDEAELRDLRGIVGEELDRLPAKYRCPLELCHLQGMTYDQAARQLDWPVATVKSRLTRGRLRLRERLSRRGLAPAAIGAAMLFGADARAAVPRELVRSMARASTARAAGAVPAAVTKLTEGVLKIMIWEKLKLVAVGALVAIGLTAEALSQRAPKDRELTAPPRAVAQTSEKPGEKAEADPRWVKTLPCGATIEVVGISAHPSGPYTWCRPDGSPLAQPPCDRSDTTITSDQNVVFRSVVARVTNLPDGADHEWWINEANGGSQGEARRGGKPVPGLDEVVTQFPAETRTCTVRFKVAAGPWQTVRTWGKSGGAAGTLTGSFIFSDAIATRKGTTISVAHDIQDRSVRLVAIDGKGVEHDSEVRSGAGVKDFSQLVVEFDLNPEQIQEFRFQVRTYEEVEIPGIVIKGTDKK